MDLNPNRKMTNLVKFAFVVAALLGLASCEQRASAADQQPLGSQPVTTSSAPDPDPTALAPLVAPITICPESNSDTTPMLWPNMISVRSAVDAQGQATIATVEVDTKDTFENPEVFDMSRGVIRNEMTTVGYVKVGKHIGGRTPNTKYYLRVKASSRGGVVYSPTVSVTTYAEGTLGTPINLVFVGLDDKSSTELKPYWRGEGHTGRRFGWKYQWSLDSTFTNVIDSYTGFYDGPSALGPNGENPRAEFKWTITKLLPGTKYYVKLSAWNRGGYTENIQSFTTDAAAVWSGTIDQKRPDSRWGWLRSDPRDLTSQPISLTNEMKFGAAVYDGNHTKASTTGEDAYTVYVDKTGFTRMWMLGQPGAFTASTDTGGGTGAGTSNIAKAVRALKGIGGIVRVAYAGGAPYRGGDFGGLSNSATARAANYEAYWDNGKTVSDPAFEEYPLTYVRIQAADSTNKPLILNGLNINASHGSVNGLYFKGFEFKNSGGNASSIMAPGYAYGGMIGFYDCLFSVDLANASYNGYGIKWHIKATGCFAFDLRRNKFTPAREHSGYLNSIGALGGVDSYFVDNEVLTAPGLNKAGVRANGRTMFQTDSRGDLVAAGNALSTQTGLAPGRGTIWYVGNIACNGGDDGGKGLSIPGHFGRIVVDRHKHLPDPIGKDFGFMNTVEDVSKGAWLNENGFAVGQVDIYDLDWNVTNTIANMYICQSTETVTIYKRPKMVMNNRVAFAFSEVTLPPFPRSVGKVTMLWAGTADDALRTDSAWPTNLSPDNKVKHEFSTQVKGSPVFDDTAAGKANFNTLSKGFVFEAIV